MNLSHEDVQAILKILDTSEYDELTLETEAFTLSLKRNSDGNNWTQETATSSTHITATASPLTASKSDVAPRDPDPTEAGLIDIRAPIVGTFYRAPKPGADPYVAIGSSVSTNTVIGIIEVMKLMNTIPAATTGKVVEILVEDGQAIEKGQLVMRVRPA